MESPKKYTLKLNPIGGVGSVLILMVFAKGIAKILYFLIYFKFNKVSSLSKKEKPTFVGFSKSLFQLLLSG
jgi:hypothetical protein